MTAHAVVDTAQEDGSRVDVVVDGESTRQAGC